MKKLEIYEPPLCCPTGVCGPAPDPALSTLQENILRWRGEGIDVERIALNQDPRRFMANKTVAGLLVGEGQQVLPLALLDGVVVSKGKYPSFGDVAGVDGTGGPAPGGCCSPRGGGCCCG